MREVVEPIPIAMTAMISDGSLSIQEAATVHNEDMPLLSLHNSLLFHHLRDTETLSLAVSTIREFSLCRDHVLKGTLTIWFKFCCVVGATPAPTGRAPPPIGADMIVLSGPLLSDDEDNQSEFSSVGVNRNDAVALKVAQVRSAINSQHNI